jgi:anaerobic sulfite reductase subunit B
MTDTLANPYVPLPAEILSVRPETSIDFTYRLAWPHQPQPGQFFEVSVPGLGEAPISVCDFGQGYIEMTIRKVGRVTDGIFALSAGDRLFLRGPYGRGFPLERLRHRHLIIAAGGTGLAPVRSVISHFAYGDGRTKAMDVLLGFKTTGDVLFADDINRWSQTVRVEVTVDRPDEGWQGHSGVITTLVPKLDIPDLASVEAVVVGPPMMMKFTVLALLDRGIPEDRIWVSYERRMSCGIGKCGHCKINDRYVCLDGPVFNLSEARWLMD